MSSAGLWVGKKNKKHFFFKQGNKQFFWTLAVLPVQFCGFVGNVRRRWVTKGCWWIFYVLIDHRYVWAGTIWTTCCAGFEVCPSVMITYEHISRPRRLITISRTPADHTPFECSVFLSWLYVAWASCYQNHGSPLCLAHTSPTRHEGTSWKLFSRYQKAKAPLLSVSCHVRWFPCWKSMTQLDHCGCGIREPTKASLRRRK